MHSLRNSAAGLYLTSTSIACILPSACSENRTMLTIIRISVAILEYDGFQAVCVGCKDTRSECISQIQGEKGYITVHAEPSNCAQFDLYIGKDKAEDLNTKQRDITLYYELQDFKKIFEENDHAACDALLEHSRKVVSVYEKLRKGAGILFACDK